MLVHRKNGDVGGHDAERRDEGGDGEGRGYGEMKEREEEKGKKTEWEGGEVVLGSIDTRRL